MTLQANTPPRIVYIVSDGTGITAENFSQSILAQFEASFRQVRIPFVDTVGNRAIVIQGSKHLTNLF